MEGQNKIERLIADIREYVETRIDLAIINIQDRLTDVIASIASTLLLSVVTVFILFFISMGIAWNIGERLNSPSMGFYCVGGFYILVFIIIFLTREKLVKLPIINALIKKITINEED